LIREHSIDARRGVRRSRRPFCWSETSSLESSAGS